MFHSILIPIAADHDSDVDDAIDYAKRLCAAGGKIILLAVIEPIPGYIATSLPREVMYKNRAQAQAALDKYASGVNDAETVILSGPAGATISAFASEQGVDLIVMGSHRPGLQDYFLGSTSARVVRHAPCSVFVLR